MPQCESLEALLQAQYDLETAEPQDLPACRACLHARVDEAIAGTHLTRTELLSVLRDRYKDFKRAQLLAEARRRTV